MKKLSVLSIVIFLVAIISFAFIYTEKTQASKPDAMSNVLVEFHVDGCNSCTFSCCIDRGIYITTSSCVFQYTLPEGKHTICVTCPYSKHGEVEFNVNNSGEIFVVDVPVVQDGAGCNCDISKTKKK